MTTTDVWNGVLPVDKPVGPTSHDIVAMSRRALRTRRIGHTGTLDPFASGLLLLCVGQATRVAEFLSGSNKRYTATVRFGIATDTDDHTGAVISEMDVSSITRADVERAFDTQRGPLAQVPPAYSAKKKEGKRAYALARAGHAVELEASHVTVHALEVTHWEPPFADIDVTVSTGTYIRSIARDAGALLGVGGHLTALRRTAVAGIDVATALSLDDLADGALVAKALIAPLDALTGMMRVDLGDDDIVHIRHGRSIPAPEGVEGDVALAANGELVALAKAHDGRIHPRKVFA